MWKIVCDCGRIARKDNSMIFKYVVWLMDHDEYKKYHIIEWNSLDEMKVNLEDYLVFEELPEYIKKD